MLSSCSLAHGAVVGSIIVQVVGKIFVPILRPILSGQFNMAQRKIIVQFLNWDPGFEPTRCYSTLQSRNMPELIDFTLEAREEIPSTKPGMLKPFASNQRVRISSVYASLDDVSTALNRGDNPENQSRRTRLLELTHSYMRTLIRIQ